MARTKVVVVYAVPIPVGHRITMRWYRHDSTGLFGGKKTKQRDYEPVIIDHDTGIEWMSDFAHDGGDGMKRPDTPIGMADVPNGGFEVEREIAGRVTACRVVHVRAYSEIDVQTHLEIET
jgi:hypothetical protein